MSVNPPPVPTEPLANKAVVAAIGTIVTVLLRWAVSGEFTLSDEGLISLAGAITTTAVYAVSNYRRILGLKSERGYAAVELLIVVLIVLILVFVLLRVA